MIIGNNVKYKIFKKKYEKIYIKTEIRSVINKIK